MALVAALESDLRRLSVEARQGEGFAGWASGILGSQSNPQLREAAESAMLKLRSLPKDEEEFIDALSESKEILDAVLHACKVRNTRLVAVGLSLLQKIVAQGALKKKAFPVGLQCFQYTAESSDESVQLKTLQLLLTLMQSQMRPETEDNVAVVIAVCARLLLGSKSSDSVRKTAESTLRHVMALVVSHAADASCQTREQQSGDEKPSPYIRVSETTEHGEGYEPTSNGVTKNENAVSASASTMPPCTYSAYCLIRYLAAIVSGEQAKWRTVPPIPKKLALDVLENTLNSFHTLFRDVEPLMFVLQHVIVPAIRDALVVEVRTGTDHYDCRPVERRLYYRLAGVVIRKFSRDMPKVSENFLSLMLDDMDGNSPLWKRIFVLQVLRSLCKSPLLIQELYTQCDWQLGHQSVVCRMVDSVAKFIDAGFAKGDNQSNFDGAGQGNSGPASVDRMDYQNRGGAASIGLRPLDEEGVYTIEAIFSKKANGTEQQTSEHIHVTHSQGEAAKGQVVAIESILAIVGSIRELTDLAIEQMGSPKRVHEEEGGGKLVFIGDLCRDMVQTLWKTILSSLQILLSQFSADSLVAGLLEGFHSFTLAAGNLKMVSCRDAFLSSLCHFTLSPSNSAERAERYRNDSEHPAPGSPRSRGKFLERTSSRRLRRTPSDDLGSQKITAEEGLDHQTDSHISEGVVLTLRNILALRTLFDLANELADSLDSSWDMIVSTLDALDHTLHSRLGSQDGSNSAATAVPNVPELAVLSAAVSRLFSATAGMKEDVVLHLFNALKSVSENSLPAGGEGAPRSTGLYALGHMVDILEQNAYRSMLFWNALMEHILDVMRHSSIAIRARSLDALGRAIGAVLANGEKSRLFPHDEDANAESSVLERVALAPLNQLYGGADYPSDVHMGTLRVLLQLLQRHGEGMSDGWGTLFRLLTEVAGTADPESVSLGFQCVQVIMNDFLSNVPFPLLKDSIMCLSHYTQQRADLNISLSALGLLWNAVDYLGSVIATQQDVAAGIVDETSVENPAASVRPEEIEALVLALFMALRGQGTDSRPEVRNTGVRTLFSAMISHGGRLSAAGWARSFEMVVIPMVSSISKAASASSTEECEGTALGSEGGHTVHMMVHHSRNSAHKQWDETLSLLAHGIGRLLKTHLGLLLAVPAFLASFFPDILQFIDDLINGGSPEVSCASIGSLLTILLCPAWEEASSSFRNLWTSGFEILLVASRAEISTTEKPDVTVPLLSLKARIELVNALGRIVRSTYGEVEIDAVIKVFDTFMRTAGTERDAPPILSSDILPHVQRAIFEQMTQMAFEDDKSWEVCLQFLLLYPSEIAQQEPGADIEPLSTSELLASKSLSALSQLLEGSDRVPSKVRSEVVEDILVLVTGIYNINTGSALWCASNTGLAVCIHHCIPIAFKLRSLPWEGLVSAFEDFIETRNKYLLGKPEKDATMTCDAVLNAFTDIVCPICGSAPGYAVERLVAALGKGASLSTFGKDSRRSHLIYSCLKRLFVLCQGTAESDDSNAQKLACAALPLFISCSKELLVAHEDIDVDIFINVLELLEELVLDLSVVKRVLGYEDGIAESNRCHLLILYGPLCHSISNPTPEVRLRLQRLLGLAGVDLGLLSHLEDAL